MVTYHAAHWSSDPSRYSPSEEEENLYRNTHQPRTKRRGNRQQQERQRYLERWTWEEILDGKGPWTQPGEYRRPKAELEAAKAERRHYEELARRPVRYIPAPRMCRARVGIEPGVMKPYAWCPRFASTARCGTFQLLVWAGLEWASSQVS
jgi:hypothetical protein